MNTTLLSIVSISLAVGAAACCYGLWNFWQKRDEPVQDWLDELNRKHRSWDERAFDAQYGDRRHRDE